MRRTTCFLFTVLMAGCAAIPPKNPSNLCSIFQEKEDWYASAKKAQQRWRVPVPVQMAIINQESSFVEDARPPLDWFLGIIPLGRPTSAYGYGQATDDTWDWYQDETHNDDADRDEFEDVTDFIGWYTQHSQAQFGIPKYDAYRQYLAYHEGHGGYRRKTYKSKAWLLQVARKVASTAGRYQRQLSGCQASLENSLASRE
jgi:hypothetical protein